MLGGSAGAETRDLYYDCAVAIWERYGEDNSWQVTPPGGNPETFEELLRYRLHCPQIADGVLEPDH